MTQWLYIFGEPKRHPDIFEIGQTRKTVEERNRAKRSIDKWIEMARYPVADSRKAEADLIRRTKKYRYKNRKEILEIPYDKLERIAKQVAEKHSDINYEVDKEMKLVTMEYDIKEYGPASRKLNQERLDDEKSIKAMYGGSPYDKHHQGNVKRGLFVWMPLLIAGTVGLFFIHPVSYTHLTLPTNREV